VHDLINVKVKPWILKKIPTHKILSRHCVVRGWSRP